MTSQKSQSTPTDTSFSPQNCEGTPPVDFSTPKQNVVRHRLVENLMKDQVSKSPLLKIPASPLLERLGYGTGVGVFLLERSPRPTGETRSPWAIKKTVKVEETSDLIAARLEYEAEVLKQLNHPNIIGYRAFGKPTPDNTFLAMEKASKSLADLIEARIEEVMLFDDCDSAAPFPAVKMEKVAFDVAKALTYLHEQVKMVHGDLKSANVLVFGDFETIKLCDFGVARKLSEDGVVEGKYTGTEIWNPMEVLLTRKGQNNQPVTYKADIYPFGLTIHEMITLKPPHLSTAEESYIGTVSTGNSAGVSGTEDTSAEESFFDDNAYEDALSRCIGTRPPLPDIDFDSTYNIILGIFYCCTDEDPTKRPDGKDIVAALQSPETERDA